MRRLHMWLRHMYTCDRVSDQAFSLLRECGKKLEPAGGVTTPKCYHETKPMQYEMKPMQSKVIQIASLAVTLAYGVFIVWIYATEPRTFKDVRTGAEVAAGTYQVDQQRFNSALDLFRREQFRAARDEWQRADPAQGDPRTQFYIAYSFYREGWGRLYYDQQLFKQGLEAVNRAIALAANSPLTVDDPNLQMHSASELKAEFEQGIERSWNDVNPLKVMRTRK